MKKTILYIIFSLAITFILSIVLLLIGMNIGGNYFTDFEFMGSRGYEATANIGFFVGIFLGALISIIGYFKFIK